MNVTQIAFTDVGKVKLESVSRPLPGANQVQVQLAVSAISSGTERANLSGDANISIYGAPETKFPRYCGYSSAGVVIAVGEKVDDLKVGDRVAIGGSVHSQVVNVPRKSVCLLPDSVPFEAAALFYIATFTLGAIRKCRIELGEPVLVMGLGVLGEPLNVIPLSRSTCLDGVESEDFGFAVLSYQNGVSTVKTTDVEKGGFIRRQLLVVGSKKTVEIRPLEQFGEKLLYTTRTDYATDGWDDGGVSFSSEPFDRYKGMMSAFATYVRGEKKNPYTLDYELQLYRIIIKACGLN